MLNEVMWVALETIPIVIALILAVVFYDTAVVWFARRMRNRERRRVQH